MVKVFKTVNTILRAVFIGTLGLFAIAKIFSIKPAESNTAEIDDADRATSEFDEIW